jgi:integral membrane sensor domain MASE1
MPGFAPLNTSLRKTTRSMLMPTTSTPRHNLLIGSLLLLALLVTRSGITRSHFGTSLSLPDASWAMFFVCGALLAARWWPVLLMGCCMAVDYAVTAQGSGIDCFTAGYPLLAPAYLSLWYAGRLTQLDVSRWHLLRTAVLLLLGVTACFIIANVGYYLASDYSRLSAADYTRAVLRYWPGYLQTTAIYVLAAALLRYVQQALSTWAIV